MIGLSVFAGVIAFAVGTIVLLNRKPKETEAEKQDEASPKVHLDPAIAKTKREYKQGFKAYKNGTAQLNPYRHYQHSSDSTLQTLFLLWAMGFFDAQKHAEESSVSSIILPQAEPTPEPPKRETVPYVAPAPVEDSSPSYSSSSSDYSSSDSDSGSSSSYDSGDSGGSSFGGGGDFGGGGGGADW